MAPPVTAGIQCLTLTLVVTLVLATGVLIGSIAITSWDDLLDRARATGEDGVSQCLSSGERDIRIVAGRYLRSVLVGVDASMEKFFQVPEQAVSLMAEFSQAHHPNVSTSPAFIDTSLRAVMRSVFETASRGFVMSVTFRSIPFSHAYPTDPIPSVPANWGGFLGFTMPSEMSGIPRKDRTKIVLSMETRNPMTGGFSASPLAFVGEADSVGRIVDTSGHCSWWVDWNVPGERMGRCPLPLSMLRSPSAVEAENRIMDNMRTADGILDEPGVHTYQPAASNYDVLFLRVIMATTHPDMLNLYPRQAGRTGCFTATFSGSGLSDMLRVPELPDGSSLYAVERNPWTHVVGTLLAYNKGRHMNEHMRFMPPPFNGTIPIAELINVTNHSVVQGDPEPSVIAQHGRYVFTHEGDYSAMVRMTAEGFHSWQGPNETEFWTVTSRFTRGTTLVIYLNLLVPRESVMDAIDASNLMIRQEAHEARQDSDRRQDRAYVVMFSATAAAVSVLLVLSVVLTRLIVSPLHALAKDMACIAVMDLEAVDLQGATSRLSEVGDMQQSFRQMVDNLIEYRNYMPQSVLMKQEDSEDTSETATCSALEQSTTRTRSTGSALVGLAEQAKVKELRKRNLSVAYLNVKDWHTYCHNKPDAGVVTDHAQFIGVIMQCVQNQNGICDVFSGDRVLATFNAYQPHSSHKLACVSAAYEARKSLEQGGSLELSFACASGEGRVGHMGCAGMKKITITAGLVPWVVALERYNREHSFGGLADHYIARELSVSFVLKCVEAISFEKRAPKGSIQVFEVMDECSVEEEEWMYQLEQANSGPYAAWNEAFNAVLKQEFAEAAGRFSAWTSDSDKMCAKMRAIINAKEYLPARIQYH